VIIHILSREKTDTPIHSGRVDGEKLKELGRLIDYTAMDEIFICGPEAMIFTIRDFLTEKGIPKNKIHFELFNTVKRTNDDNTGNESLPPRQKSMVTIKLDGRSFDFEVEYTGERILDAALKQGAICLMPAKEAYAPVVAPGSQKGLLRWI
jgi:ring-1,2-phenylacetyl-CoA epoxidase subunit PaaE